VGLLHLTRDEEGNRIEVRSAGRTRRLYINGVLNTQYNPTQLITGDVWDPLALAGLIAPLGSVTDVLLLGLGGGAAIHMLRNLVEPRGQLVAVDSSATVVRLATELFRVPCETIVEDARVAVRDFAARGRRFSLVIDDVFTRESDEAQRAFPFEGSWRDELWRLLAPDGGVLVSNLAAPKELGPALADLPAAVKSAFVFRVEGAVNRILALSTHATARRELLSRIDQRVPPSQLARLSWQVTRKRLELLR
jgi:spermidine synthase